MVLSWTELAVVIGASVMFASKRDMPNGARWVGNKIGRIVGFCQGFKARAERYTQNNELASLHNELRSGLRELDAVRAEMTQTFAQPMGRGLGATVPGVNRIKVGDSMLTSQRTTETLAAGLASTPFSQQSGALHNAWQHPVNTEMPAADSMASPSHLAPTNHTIGAIAEEEWSRKGIDFTSRAELGSGLRQHDHSIAGSAVLSNLLQQSLIFDQYDRVTQEQQAHLQSKADRIQQKVQSESKENSKK